MDQKISDPANTAPEEEIKKTEKAESKKTAHGKNDSSDIGELLNNIVYTAYVQKASDIHIESTEHDLLVRYRIDGLLYDKLLIDKSFEDELIFKIKISAKIRTDEHFAPQDGRIAFKFPGVEGKLDTRISILPTSKGQKVVIRLLTKEGKTLSLEQLGIRGKSLEMVQKSYEKPWGMILAVGPTGSGKTTTLYAILQVINSREKNVTTIEDPVEFEIDGVNHIQVNPNGNLTFASGLRSILRQDPDIVMVGEIRDTETARIAINAAMTGHLVLSTLHTNDAVTTVPRLIDMGIEPYLVASTVNLIMAQRLARLLCEKCKEEYEITADELKHLTSIRPDIAKELKLHQKLYKHVGCKECNNTGYRGRIGLYEILEVTKTMREMISDQNFNVDKLYDETKKWGLIRIFDDAINKMNQGLLDVPELIRVIAMTE